MKNAAYTKEYITYRRHQEAVFNSNFFKSEEIVTLSSHYRLRSRSYAGYVGEYHLHAAEHELLDLSGRVLYTYRNLDDSAEFHRIIEHSDGGSYLIFRTDLYGYSVLDLTTLRDFHYIPSDSFPTGETFIWTDVFYNRENDVLAVSGCYWACPFGTLLVDFSHPMELPERWVDVQEQLENGYDRYDDVDFEEWRGTDLILKAMDCETEKQITISLSGQTYGKWLKERRT